MFFFLNVGFVAGMLEKYWRLTFYDIFQATNLLLFKFLNHIGTQILNICACIRKALITNNALLKFSTWTNIVSKIRKEVVVSCYGPERTNQKHDINNINVDLKAEGNENLKHVMAVPVPLAVAPAAYGSPSNTFVKRVQVIIICVTKFQFKCINLHEI